MYAKIDLHTKRILIIRGWCCCCHELGRCRLIHYNLLNVLL